MPDHTTFDAAASDAGWSCPDGSPAGSPCTFLIGGLAAGASSSVAFAVTVAQTLPAGVTEIANAAGVTTVLAAQRVTRRRASLEARRRPVEPSVRPQSCSTAVFVAPDLAPTVA